LFRAVLKIRPYKALGGPGSVFVYSAPPRPSTPDVVGIFRVWDKNPITIG